MQYFLLAPPQAKESQEDGRPLAGRPDARQVALSTCGGVLHLIALFAWAPPRDEDKALYKYLHGDVGHSFGHNLLTKSTVSTVGMTLGKHLR